MSDTKHTYYCYNANGSVTGSADVTETEVGFSVKWSQGSPWAGGHCDDGPTGEATFPTLERVHQYLDSHGVDVPLTR